MSTTDTERDERLRQARDWAERLRESLPRLPGGPTVFEETVLALADEVTRLDAVVTAVRDLHQPEAWDDELAGASGVACSTCVDGNEDPVAYPCPTVRALDRSVAIRLSTQLESRERSTHG